MGKTFPKRGPDFIIIGAMKCMTSTIHEQLSAQPGIRMSIPKEPCYFSDDGIYARGPDWYASLFSDCESSDICGESSTHYTKLPSYPKTVQRLIEACPNVKLIYVMRHPIDRLYSQYVHEWSQRVVNDPIEVAIEKVPELVHYSRYAYQLTPYLTEFGPRQVLPVFFDRVAACPQEELERICRFLGYRDRPEWREALQQVNVSEQRMRISHWRDWLTSAPGISWVRRNLIPQGVRDHIKQYWQMKKKPKFSTERLIELKELFDEDLCHLGDWLGVPLTCDVFRETTASRKLGWRDGLEKQFRTGPATQEVIL